MTKKVTAINTIYAGSDVIEPGKPWDCPDDEYDALKAAGHIVDAPEDSPADPGKPAPTTGDDNTGTGDDNTGTGDDSPI